MSRLSAFLAEIPTPIARERARAVLEKQFRFSSIGIATLAEWIEHQVSEHGAAACRLDFSGTDTKKRVGVRFESKPKWALMSPDSGMDIGKTAARYAQSLGVAPALDIDAHEKAYLAEWEKHSGAEARHRGMYGSAW
jgi:hypothetical protein